MTWLVGSEKETVSDPVGNTGTLFVFSGRVGEDNGDGCGGAQSGRGQLRFS